MRVHARGNGEMDEFIFFPRLKYVLSLPLYSSSATWLLLLHLVFHVHTRFCLVVIVFGAL